MEQRYVGKGVIVTGAGSGIGRGVAERLGAEGGKVACLDVNLENAQETANSIGNGALAFACDVSNWEQVESVVAEVTKAFGQVDMLCNVAGIGGFANSHDVDPSKFERMIAVNLTGTFLMCRAVLPQMVERGHGVIVNTASTAGVMGQPWSAAYCASKGGVSSLTRALATEYDTPIRISAVAPGGVETNMYSAFIPPENADFNRMRKMSRDNVEVAKPAELASLYAYLGSDEARYVTGATMVMDGGISC
jgi:NAD(P)-dependent dehydrogenase (short-subunit alcohol dehydrogenase family)